MQKSTLIQCLSQLSPQEMAQFRDFVYSPYFNKHEKTRVLFDYLLKLNSWESTKLAKEKVFAKVFPKQPYEEQLLSNVISYLLRLVRQFYVQKQLEKEPYEQQLNLLTMSLDAGQEKLFSLTANKAKKAFATAQIQDSNFYFQQNKYGQLLDDFDLKYGKRTDGVHLENALAHFDIFYIGEKLKMTCRMLARRQVTGQDYAFPLTREILDYLEKEAATFQKIPSVWIYFLVYQMMISEELDFYFELKNRLSKDVSIFTHAEGRDLYSHALNYCIGRLNQGEANFGKEAFELYQQMLEIGLLYNDGVLQQWDYTNFVSLGINLGEYERIEKFILNQKERLLEAVRENTHTYNLAVLHYTRKEYDKAVETLQKVEFTDVYYNLLNRILTLKIYFENDNEKALEYSLETFRIYLLRTKQISNSRRKSGLNLIRFTKKLMRLQGEKIVLSKSIFEKKIRTLQKQINDTEAVLNRAWLLEKIKEIN